MIKLGNNKFDTYPLNKCNLKILPKFVYLVPIEIEYCPICGKKLMTHYCYAIQISENECVKVYGSTCSSCDSFFSSMHYLLNYIEKIRAIKSLYILKKDYDIKYNLLEYVSRFKKTKSAFRQFTILTVGKMRVYTLITEREYENTEKNIIHYSSKIAIELLMSENEHKNSVEIDGIMYSIISIKRKAIDNMEIKDDIDNVIANKKLFGNEIPELSTSKTLYVYRGNIRCHTKHHVEEFKANIKLLDNNKKFYVEYCYDCNKFIMKESDYSEYLHNFKLFPMKVCKNEKNCIYDMYNRADKSPLMLNGYTVSRQVGLGSDVRHYILSFIMDYGIMNKRKVVNYLDDFIRFNKNNLDKRDAINKWEEDKRFVLSYNQREKPIVNIGKLERR